MFPSLPLTATGMSPSFQSQSVQLVQGPSAPTFLESWHYRYTSFSYTVSLSHSQNPFCEHLPPNYCLYWRLLPSAHSPLPATDSPHPSHFQPPPLPHSNLAFAPTSPPSTTTPPSLPHLRLQRRHFRTSLMVQWLRICLPMQGTQVRSQVWEDSTWSRATKLMGCNYWSLSPGACAPQEKPPQWEACTP